MSEDRTAFDSDTMHRMSVEAARFWVIEHYLRTGDLPTLETRFAYADGPYGFGWGTNRPLRGKRVRITFEVEDWN